MESETFLYITQSITLALFIWSEYLGMTPKNKSNAVAQLLICAANGCVRPEPPVSAPNP